MAFCELGDKIQRLFLACGAYNVMTSLQFQKNSASCKNAGKCSLWQQVLLPGWMKKVVQQHVLARPIDQCL